MHRSRVSSGAYSGGTLNHGLYPSSNPYGNKPTKSKERTISITFGRGDGERHCGGIQALALHGNALLSASRDGTVKRWALKEDQAPLLEGSYEGHSDWVNDVTFVENHLATASSDGTVKLWHPVRRDVIASLNSHQDYVSCLASAPGHPYLASAGLRSEIFLHTVEVDVTSTRKLFPATDAADKGSVYSLAMDRYGKMIAAGSTDAVIRLFDIRTAAKTMKLKGHTENVRCLALNSDGTKLLSGSSDHSMKLWDLGHQRCIQVDLSSGILDSVWSLLATESFNVVISGGRDRCIFKTCLSQRTSELLFMEDEPIQDMVKTGNDSALWVATASSSIKKWNLPTKISGEYGMWSALETTNRTVPGRAFLIAGSTSRRSMEPMKNLEPIEDPPAVIIEGIPPIVDHAVLNDQYRILSKDKLGEVALWNVTTGSEIENFGKIDFQEKLQELHEFVSVPRWFTTVEKKLGQLTLVLKHPQCFAAEFYAADLGLDAAEDRRLNYAQCMLKGLLGRWVLETEHEVFEDVDPVDVWGDGWIDRKKNTIPAFRFWDNPRGRIILSGVSKSNEPWKIPVSEISANLNQNAELPDWVEECIMHGKIPSVKEWKFSFHLLPADTQETVPPLSQSRLNAPRILQVRKVATYLRQRLAELDPPFPINVIPYGGESYETHGDSEETNSLPDEMDIDVPDIELICKGEAVPFGMSIGAVFEYMWKESKDLIIHYRIRTSKPAPPPTLTVAKSAE